MMKISHLLVGASFVQQASQSSAPIGSPAATITIPILGIGTDIPAFRGIGSQRVREVR
jgi:hypothetical protein